LAIRSVVHIAIFAALGSLIGLTWGFAMKEFALLPLISGLLVGVYLGWFFRSRRITAKLLVLFGVGTGAGMYVGVLPGMVVGTILSIPFPDSFWEFFYLLGLLMGMTAVGAGAARWFVHLSDWKPSP
jgi:hypothetical protein